jgi:hypothetical protein
MTLSDALLELAVRWDDDVSRSMRGDACRQLERQLDAAVRRNDTKPLVEALHGLVAVVGQHDPIIDALDRPRFRGDDATVGALPARRIVDGEGDTWDRPTQESDETFLALVLRNRMREQGPVRTRVAARRATLSALTGDAPHATASSLIRAVPVAGSGPAAPEDRADALACLIAFDPAEAFLEMPSWMRTWQTVGSLRSAVRLVPDFQLPSDEAGYAGRVNSLLEASRDPWGVASWWTTPNAWLGARPLDLLGTDRAGEILQAARELTSGAW